MNNQSQMESVFGEDSLLPDSGQAESIDGIGSFTKVLLSTNR
jgi:hypothetical protein